jgi:hypothetical protein
VEVAESIGAGRRAYIGIDVIAYDDEDWMRCDYVTTGAYSLGMVARIDSVRHASWVERCCGGASVGHVRSCYERRGAA